MDKKEFLGLLERIRSGEATDKDILLYNTWFAKFQTSDVWNSAEQGNAEEINKKIHSRIRQQIDERPKNVNKSRLFIRFTAAAAILIIVFTAGFHSFYQKAIIKPQIAENRGFNAFSNYNRATLTLNDGRQVLLSEGKVGKVASEPDASIQNLTNGRIFYQNIAHQTTLASDAASYNVLNTPNGGQYQIEFTDGSRAFLNAASRLRYPTTFRGNERVVELDGEAYFEVVHDAAKPFKVISKGQVVEVLGTHFNINSYGNEASVKTTLVEGSIRILAGGKKSILKPGQQLTINAKQTYVKQTDVEAAVAWKNGFLEFDNRDIQSVMREISRWFDVNVEFQNPANTVKYTARISKYSDIREVLKILESTKTIHFKIYGKKIVVT